MREAPSIPLITALQDLGEARDRSHRTVQLRGDEVQEVKSGDSVWIEPGEEHWHGAMPGRTMVHLAMQEPDENGVDVVWMEQVEEAELVTS